MKLYYNVEDKPSFKETIVFALQQLLAIMAATIAVPAIVQNGMSPSAALFGAGVGTLVYLLFTKFKSPVFLGSSFSFLPSMFAAFAGAVTVEAGFLGLIIGAILAGLVYVVLSLVVKSVGSKWIDKFMPAVVIGPTVAIIGLCLARNAIGDLIAGGLTGAMVDDNGNFIISAAETATEAGVFNANYLLYLACGLVTLFTTILFSVYGKGFLKMIPFVLGILAGYICASILTGIGWIASVEALKVIDFTKFAQLGTIEGWIPQFSFIKAFKGMGDFDSFGSFMAYFGTIAVAYVPVGLVVFAEHIADHKNISSIIERDLLVEPGLNRTLLGDGVGSMAGAFFGGCPNTTYGESIGCVAISGNASVVTILTTSIMAIVISFIGPFSIFLSTIPSCVMGGVCIALYGFIAVSGLKMIQKADLGDNRNLFVVSLILIAGVGGFGLNFSGVVLTDIACALLLGILVNVVVSRKKNDDNNQEVVQEENQEVVQETVQEGE